MIANELYIKIKKVKKDYNCKTRVSQNTAFRIVDNWLTGEYVNNNIDLNQYFDARSILKDEIYNIYK